MQTTLYWHDYETFGQNPRWAGIAQFAGIRTDESLQEIGDPLMVYCQPPQDSWPDPAACLITGITPQHCRQQGLPDYRFARTVLAELARPGTCGVGFNSIRFDDEFTRQLLYRNFHDPYEREWRNGNSRWDLLDVLRMARALRPEGINWPVDDEGNPTMKLERLTAANGIGHADAHDALADVRATIAMARLLRQAQPRLYDFAFRLRDKQFAGSQLDLVQGKPVLHTSGKYGGRRLFTTLAMPLVKLPDNRNGVVVADLMQDPASWLGLDADALRERLYTPAAALSPDQERPGLKTVHLNRSPMLAPVSLLDDAVAQRLGIDRERCERHRCTLLQHLPALQALLADVFGRSGMSAGTPDAEFMLYGGFASPHDKRQLESVRRATEQDLARHTFVFEDARYRELLFRYRARNFPASLSPAEQAQWHEFRHRRLHERVTDDWITRDDFLAAIAEQETCHAGNPAKLALLADLRQWEAEVS